MGVAVGRGVEREGEREKERECRLVVYNWQQVTTFKVTAVQTGYSYSALILFLPYFVLASVSSWQCKWKLEEEETCFTLVYNKCSNNVVPCIFMYIFKMKLIQLKTTSECKDKTHLHTFKICCVNFHKPREPNEIN